MRSCLTASDPRCRDPGSSAGVNALSRCWSRVGASEGDPTRPAQTRADCRQLLVLTLAGWATFSLTPSTSIASTPWLFPAVAAPAPLSVLAARERWSELSRIACCIDRQRQPQSNCTATYLSSDGQHTPMGSSFEATHSTYAPEIVSGAASLAFTSHHLIALINRPAAPPMLLFGI